MRYFYPTLLNLMFFGLILSATFLPVTASANTTITRDDINDLIIIDLADDYTVYAGGGIDTVLLPLFPNEFLFTQAGGSQYTTQYQGYTSLFDSVENVQFGILYQTTLPIAEMLSGTVQDRVAKLTDLYLAFFGRAPDVTGLEYWQMRHLTEGRNSTIISMDFSWSEEAQALFPLGQSNRNFVKTVYQNCFGRDPDEGGWNYWTNKLDALDPNDPDYLNDRGAFVGELLLGAYAPTSGEEDRSLLINRHEVALAYVNHLKRQSWEDYDPSKPWEDYDASINDLLAMVVMDSASRYNAENVIEYVFNNAATLSEVMGDQNLLNALWTHESSYDIDDDGDGWTEIQGDCNDTQSMIYPGAYDTCSDGIDQDCDGVDQSCPDNDGDGWMVSEGDCNDAEASIYPGAPEICDDGIDQDCSGQDLDCSTSCNETPSLTDLAGTWDQSEDYGVEGYDESYIVIRTNGTYQVYDYAGDSYDDYVDCYWTETGTFTDLGNGTFSLDGETGSLKTCGNELFVKDGGPALIATRSAKTSFTPICSGGGDYGTPGSPQGYLTPELVSTTLTFNTIEASGWHTCGVAGDGATYCWGTNDYGQLGSTENMELCTDLFRENYSCTGTPHQVDTDLRFVVLAGSLGQGVTCGLTAGGEAYCWGFGLGGQLGDGQQTNSATPIAVSGGLQFESIRVSSDGSGACGTTATGDLYCWGALGLVLTTGYTNAAAFTPYRVDAAQGFISFDLGQMHACGVSATGQAYCWGNNWYGQLGVGSAGGDGGLMQVATPTAVVGGHVFRSIVTGSNQTCALTETGEAYCWGIGINVGSNFNTTGYVGTPQPVSGGHSYVELYAGFTQTCGLTAAGEAYCWGENYLGELGDGTQESRMTPVKVQTSQKFVSLSHRPTCGLTAQGQAYCWGDNGSGQVGQPPYYENH